MAAGLGGGPAAGRPLGGLRAVYRQPWVILMLRPGEHRCYIGARWIASLGVTHVDSVLARGSVALRVGLGLPTAPRD